jgi:hypothetical protein
VASELDVNGVPADHRGVKRITFFVFVASFVVLGVATPALGQKDPFKPLITEEVPAGQTVTQTGQQPAASPAAPAPVDTSTEGAGLARTGIQADGWVPIALVLLLVGAAVLVLDRYRRLA